MVKSYSPPSMTVAMGPGSDQGPVTIVAISGATGGNNTLVAASSTGHKIRVLQLALVPLAATTLRFESGAGGAALTGLMSLDAKDLFVLPYSGAGWFETGTDALLNMELGTGTQTSGVLTYQLVLPEG